nr:hypothetical protein [Tanacetum cinerariifolium]
MEGPNFGIRIRASAKLILKFKSLKIWKNFSRWLRSTNWRSNGINDRRNNWLRVKNWNSVRTIGGWTSLVLPLLVGCTVSLVALVSRSTTEGREEVVVIVGPWYAVPLRVVIPFRSSFGLVIVLLGRVPKPEDEAVFIFMKRSHVGLHILKNGTVCLHEIGEFIGGDNLRLRNLGLMNRSLVNQSLISWRLVLILVSSLEELVPSLVVPLRIMVSLIPVLVLKVMVLIVTVLILVET